MEVEIIHELAVDVLEHKALLATCSELFGELDVFIALASAAEDYA
jgi:hypothetical protein